MSINATLLAQMIVFILLVWFTMKYVWPVIRAAMDEREQRIADGLAAAERGQSNLEQAKVEAQKIIDAARSQAKDIMDAAQSRANDIVEEAKNDGERERGRQIAMGRSELEQELGRARDELRGQVAAIAMAGAERILAREIDASAHRELLEQLAADL
jgi:F-type H+-transporting ATPase subunit b